MLLIIALCGLMDPIIPAQTVSPGAKQLVISDLGAPNVNLGGSWQFRLGDDPRWASPAYDDSGWGTITTDKGWDLQGYSAIGKFGWYRRHIQLADSAANSLPLAMAQLSVRGAYEVFWNGVRVGGCGEFSPHVSIPDCWKPMSLPGGGNSGGAVVAIRIFSLVNYGFLQPGAEGLQSPPQIGSQNAIEASTMQHLYLQQRSGRIAALVGVLYVVAALITWMVWLLQGGEKLYLWLAIFLSIEGFRLFISLWGTFGGLPWEWEQLLDAFFGYGCLSASLWMLLMRFFRLDESRYWRRLTAWMIVLCLTLHLASPLPDFFMSAWTGLTALLFRLCWICSTCITLYSLVLIAAVFRRKLDAARWCVAISATVATLWPVINNLFRLLRHWEIVRFMGRSVLTLWGGNVSLLMITNLFLLFSLIYAATEALTSARRQRLKTELEKTIIETDLSLAAQVQAYLTPTKSGNVKGASIWSTSTPARHVSGDLHDLFYFDEHHVGLLCADVSGKGISSALVMAHLQGLTHAHLTVRRDSDGRVSPAQLASYINGGIFGHSELSRYATFFYAEVDIRKRRLVYVNAGHCRPLLVHDGEVSQLTKGDLPVGLFAETNYTEHTVALPEGSKLIIFTDGVTEALNEAGEQYGDERLLAAASIASTLPNARDVGRFLQKEVSFWSKGVHFDDATFVILSLESFGTSLHPIGTL